jgi:hypothetical protein
VHWDIARHARRGCIDKLLVLAEVIVDSLADSELIEVVFFPTKNLEDRGAEVFEGSLVGNVEVAMPTWEEVARL